MKPSNALVVFGVLGLFLLSILAQAVLIGPVKAEAQNVVMVQLSSFSSGETSLTGSSTHSSPYAAKLVIPLGGQVGSDCMVLYPYNKPLSTLQSFQVYTQFANNVPRFLITLDNDRDGSADFVLLSDYTFTGNGTWQLSEGGLRWGWTEASVTLDIYGRTWNNFSYWKSLYCNATALSVGVALEYWAVKDSNGLDQPLYADEAIINGVTYNIANQPAVPQSGDDWSMYRHDFQNTGKSTSAPSNGCPLWQFATSDKIRSTPSIANNTVYVGSNNGVLYALNAATGGLIWEYNSGSQIESSAAVANGVVYVGILWDGHNGYVDAINATTGLRIWRYATNSGIESSPAVVNGIVYIGSYLGYIYALNATDGALIWSYLTGASTYSSPAVVDNVVYIGSLDGRVYALNAGNGALIWAYQMGSPVYASPAVVNGTVYANSDNGYLYALNASDGSKVWQAFFGSGSDHSDDSPAVANGIVYVGARNGYYAFNATDGSQIWVFTSPYSQRQTTGYIYSSPIVAGNIIYYGSFDSRVFALNALTGSLVWSYSTGGFMFSSPAIANGVVYIGSFDGKVYAIGTNSGKMVTPTPPSPTPTPTPASTSQPTPTATPFPTATTKPTQQPNPTTTQTPTPLPPHEIILSKSQQTPEPTRDTEVVGGGFIDWLILLPIVVIATLALVGLFAVFKNEK